MIAIIDYGSQYTQLIARRVRELNVYSIILPYDFKESYIEFDNHGLYGSKMMITQYMKSNPYI